MNISNGWISRAAVCVVWKTVRKRLEVVFVAEEWTAKLEGQVQQVLPQLEGLALSPEFV